MKNKNLIIFAILFLGIVLFVSNIASNQDIRQRAQTTEGENKGGAEEADSVDSIAGSDQSTTDPAAQDKDQATSDQTGTGNGPTDAAPTATDTNGTTGEETTGTTESGTNNNAGTTGAENSTGTGGTGGTGAGLKIDNFDIYGQAGSSYKAIIKTFNVEVTGGELSIKFTRLKQNPAINGIEIIPCKAAGDADTNNTTGGQTGNTAQNGNGTAPQQPDAVIDPTLITKIPPQVDPNADNMFADPSKDSSNLPKGVSNRSNDNSGTVPTIVDQAKSVGNALPQDMKDDAKAIADQVKDRTNAQGGQAEGQEGAADCDTPLGGQTGGTNNPGGTDNLDATPTAAASATTDNSGTTGDTTTGGADTSTDTSASDPLSTAYVEPNENDCGGKYAAKMAESPLKKNFGDPQCNFSKENLQQLLQQLDPANATKWFNLVECESTWNPNHVNNGQYWGLFQMDPSNPPGQGPEAQPSTGPSNGPNWRGDVNWQVQVQKAVAFQKEKGWGNWGGCGAK